MCLVRWELFFGDTGNAVPILVESIRKRLSEEHATTTQKETCWLSRMTTTGPQRAEAFTRPNAQTKWTQSQSLWVPRPCSGARINTEIHDVYRIHEILWLNFEIRVEVKVEIHCPQEMHAKYRNPPQKYRNSGSHLDIQHGFRMANGFRLLQADYPTFKWQSQAN